MSDGRTSFLNGMRLQFAFAPRWVYVSRAEFHGNMAAHWAEHLRGLSRPAYWESRGFTHDRWGRRGRASIAGCEKPYAWTAAYWRCFGRLLKHTFLAAMFEAMPDDGGVHHRYDSSRRHMIITGPTP